MKKSGFRIIDDFFGLFYPRLCLACGKNMPAFEEHICLTCQYKLPKTKFHLEPENTFTQRMWGRVPIVAGTAMYFFRKGGLIQELIHKLKYEGKREIGIKLGEVYGRLLKRSPHLPEVDIIVPIPLHPRKERIRGYNQSAMFAMGLSNTLGKTWSKDALRRVAHSASQTRKGLIERLENVDSIFEVAKPDLLRGKHVLLVDDVLTTGATLETCGMEILRVEGVRLSMATIAIATH